MLNRSINCRVTNPMGSGIQAMTDTKFYVPLVTLLIEENVKILQQLK